MRRQRDPVIYFRKFVLSRHNVFIADKHAAVDLPHPFPDRCPVQERKRFGGKFFDIGMQIVFDNELSELRIVRYRGKHGNFVQAVGHIDEVFYTYKLIFVLSFQIFLYYRLQHRFFVFFQKSEPLGKKIQFLYRRGVQPFPEQSAQRLAMVYGEFVKILPFVVRPYLL